GVARDGPGSEALLIVESRAVGVAAVGGHGDGEVDRSRGALGDVAEVPPHRPGRALATAGGGDERRAGGEDVAEDRVARGAVSAVRPGEVEGDARAVDERGRALRQRERGLTSGDDAGRLQEAVEEEADTVRGRARGDGEPGRVLMAGQVTHLAIGGVAVEEAG